MVEATPKNKGHRSWGAALEWVAAGGRRDGKRETPVRPRNKQAQTTIVAVRVHLYCPAFIPIHGDQKDKSVDYRGLLIPLLDH